MPLWMQDDQRDRERGLLREPGLWLAVGVAAVSAFDQFWAHYPVKRDKLRARKTFDSRGLDRCIDVVLWALQRDAAEKRHMRIHRGWAPRWKYPQGWLSALDVQTAKRGMLEEQQAKLFNQDAEPSKDNAHVEEVRRRHYEAVMRARRGNKA